MGDIDCSFPLLQVNGRSLQQHGGTVTKHGLVTSPMAKWLQVLCDRIDTFTGQRADRVNHVLINRYQPGQGILPHMDGPSYKPFVSIVSLGSPAVFRFHKIGPGVIPSVRVAQVGIGNVGSHVETVLLA